MSSVPQWNADIITPEVEAEAEIQANAGLEKDSSGALGVKVDGSSVTINNEGELEAAGGTTYTASNMISLTNDEIAVSTTAGITDVQQVAALPAEPVSTVIYLIPET